MCFLACIEILSTDNFGEVVDGDELAVVAVYWCCEVVEGIEMFADFNFLVEFF